MGLQKSRCSDTTVIDWRVHTEERVTDDLSVDDWRRWWSGLAGPGRWSRWGAVGGCGHSTSDGDGKDGENVGELHNESCKD